MLSAGGLRAVVVGGGSVGLRKVRALLKAGANVTLVEPGRGLKHTALQTTAPGLGTAPDLGTARRPRAAPRLRVIRASYRASQLRGARLVLACTDDRDLNRRIAADARAVGALVNAADQPEDCDFFMPAIVADGDVVVAIGTGSSAPALAGSLKRIMAAALPRKAGRFAQALSRLRVRLRDEIPDPRKRMLIMKRLSQPEAYREFVKGGTKVLQATAGRFALTSRARAERLARTKRNRTERGKR
jgi:precorrin-2 dehydrogenase/sirohydrochlorin ferrochelatase